MQHLTACTWFLLTLRLQRFIRRLNDRCEESIWKPALIIVIVVRGIQLGLACPQARTVISGTFTYSVIITNIDLHNQQLWWGLHLELLCYYCVRACACLSVLTVSIARRVQDPLAELVKIDPKHIGIGTYQVILLCYTFNSLHCWYLFLKKCMLQVYFIFSVFHFTLIAKQIGIWLKSVMRLDK